MEVGEMRERITLCRIVSPQGPYQIFNPDEEHLEPIREVWTKREDKVTATSWTMVGVNVISRKQFIIRYREDLPEAMAIKHKGEIYTVVAKVELGNNKTWLMLLAGRLGEDGYLNEDNW